MITVESKIDDFAVHKGLADIAMFFGAVGRCYFVDRHIKNLPLNDLKKTYLKRFGISSRHFNSIRYEMDAKALAWREGNQLLLAKKEAQIEATQKKIKIVDKEIKNLSTKKKALETFRQKMQAWRASNRKTKKPKRPAKLVRESLEEILKIISKKRFVLHHKKRRLVILQDELRKMIVRGDKPSICFGSRALFYKQFHLNENGYNHHGEWKLDWEFSRSRQSYWLGSHEESYRNQNAQYEPAKKTLTLRVPKTLEDKHGKHINIENVCFPNDQDKVDQAILIPQSVWDKKTQSWKERHKPVSYRLLSRKNGRDEIKFYCQAVFDESTPELASDPRLGAIGIDLNAEHIAVGEIDHYGNPIKNISYSYTVENQSSEQIKAVLADHITEIVERAKISGKMIVCENLDFEKKKQALRESGSPAYRDMLSSFVYKKFYDLLLSRAKRERVRVKAVNAAFTSIIGFYKFSGYKNYSSHELAAVCIARRGLGLSERARTKNTLNETVSIRGLGEARSFFEQKGIRHVWSYYSRNAKAIRTTMRETPLGRGDPVLYNPQHSSGYRQVALGMRCDRALRRSRPP